MATKKSVSAKNTDVHRLSLVRSDPIPLPAAKSDPAKTHESLDEAMGYTPPGVISFKQLESVQAAQDVTEQLQERIGQMNDMLMNIFHADTQAVPDKLKATRALFDEFVQVASAALSGNTAKSSESLAEAAVQMPARIRIIEDAGNTNRRSPVKLLVEIIQPGWGNARDNHYYPAEMLKRDAKAFVGAKMYTTDHRIEEKSVRTEVSQIESIVGFSEAGAPVARVIVFDPDFAERCRNMSDSKTLTSLSCSILADGTAGPFESGGRKGKKVESITAVSSVDWVTRAGAGGRAIALAEADKGKKKPAEPAAMKEHKAQPRPAKKADIPPPDREKVEETIDSINAKFFNGQPQAGPIDEKIDSINAAFLEGQPRATPVEETMDSVTSNFYKPNPQATPINEAVDSINAKFFKSQPIASPFQKSVQSVLNKVRRRFGGL